MIAGDVSPQPTVTQQKDVEPPLKKKRVATQKQLEALEKGRIKRREAQLAKALAKKAEMEKMQQQMAQLLEIRIK